MDREKSSVIYGSVFTHKDVIEYTKTDAIAKRMLSGECDDAFTAVYDLCEELKLDWDRLYDVYAGQDEVIVIGREWDNIGDNETGAHFKDAVVKDLKKIFNYDFHAETVIIPRRN